MLVLTLAVFTCLSLVSCIISAEREIFQHIDSASFTSDSEVKNLGRAPSNSLHTVIFACKPKIDPDVLLVAELEDIYDPRSSRYGKWLSHQEVADLTVDVESVGKLQTFLKSIDGVVLKWQSEFSDYVSIEAPVGILEKIFDTKFYRFSKRDMPPSDAETQLSATVAVRALSYSLPSNLAPYVLTVFNTIQDPFAVRRSGQIAQKELSSIDMSSFLSKKLTDESPAQQSRQAILGFAYPQLIKDHYNVFIEGGDWYSSQAVFSTIDQSFSDTDLELFQKLFSLPVEKPVKDIGGHELPGQCNDLLKCYEANLDMQYIMGTAPSVPTTFWYEKDTSSSSFTLFLIDVGDTPEPPLVISISYAMPEAALNYFDKYFFDLEAQKLALRGVTILAASGDRGVSDAQSAISCGYNPSFPASSPFVTAVGATQGPESGAPETACQVDRGGGITTGGGFSNIYPTPSWQKEATQAYFSRVYQGEDTAPFVASYQYSPGQQYPNLQFNREGRGYPDIAAMGSKYVIVVNASYYIVSGTSASTPVVAGMISLINAKRLQAGKPSVGWLNPLLYAANGSAAKDIVTGKNDCYRQSDCCREGFYAAAGWDPLTGWGAVDFGNLYKAIFLADHDGGAGTDFSGTGRGRGGAKVGSISDAETDGFSVGPVRILYGFFSNILGVVLVGGILLFAALICCGRACARPATIFGGPATVSTSYVPLQHETKVTSTRPGPTPAEISQSHGRYGGARPATATNGAANATSSPSEESSSHRWAWLRWANLWGSSSQAMPVSRTDGNKSSYGGVELRYQPVYTVEETRLNI